MPKLASELILHNTYIEFDNPAGKTFGVAPSGKVRMHANAAGTALLQSVSGAAYGVVESSGGLGDSLTLGSGGAVISADETGQITALGAGTAPFSAGRGLPLGQPPGTILLATNGAGGLTGVYQYAYAEVDGTGSSSLSAVAQITASSNTLRVTVPSPRRGTSARRLYRTDAGGSTFKLVHDFGGGSGFFQTVWDDNTADGSLGATHGGTDTSGIYELEVNSTVKYFRTHPDALTGVGDVTVLTADPATSGSYSIDAYGPIFCRTKLGNSFGSQKTGTSGTHFYAEWLSDTDDGVAAANVFNLFSTGEMQLLPRTMIDGGQIPFALTATMPTTITATRAACQINVTSAGSSSQESQSFQINMNAGYTGSSTTRAIQANTNVASAGTAFALSGTCTGASAQNCAVFGSATGGTNNFGGFFGRNQSPAGFAASAALACSNGATTDDWFRGYDAGTLVFRGRDGGAFNLSAISHSGGALSAGDLWRNTTQGTFSVFVGGTQQQLSTSMWTQTADATHANSLTESTIIGTVVGTKSVGQFAALLLAGKTLRIRAAGFLSSTGNPTLAIRVKLGAVTVLSTGDVAQSGTPTNVGWSLDAIITCRTAGVSGTVHAQGMFQYGGTFMPLVATAAVTVDTTIANVADITADWGTAVSGNSITSTHSSGDVTN